MPARTRLASTATGIPAAASSPGSRARGAGSATEVAAAVRRRTSAATGKGVSPREKFQPSPRARGSAQAGAQAPACAPSAPSAARAAGPPAANASAHSAPGLAATRGAGRGAEPAPSAAGKAVDGDWPTREAELSKCPSSSVGDSSSSSLELQASAYTLAGRRTLRCARTGLQQPQAADWANQDAYLVVPARSDRMFLAVLDGHGEHGRHVAGSVCGIFEQMAPGLLALDIPQLPSAMAQVFAVVQAALERDELARFSGTTAVVAIIDVAAAVVTTAHVGDSRLMIVGSDAEAQFETLDHKVRALGNCGPSAATRRPALQASECPGLSVSRSLGDLEAHALGTRSEPTIHENVPLRPGMALVAASDGVWQKLPRAAVAALVGASESQDSARKLVSEARARWPQRGDADDITAVVVKSRAVAAHMDPVTPRGVAAAGA